MAIAAHNYDSTYQYSRLGQDAYGVGRLAYLLPYMEQDAAAKLIDTNPAYPIWYLNPLDRPARPARTISPARR